MVARNKGIYPEDGKEEGGCPLADEELTAGG
jgi:hypothetical protein